MAEIPVPDTAPPAVKARAKRPGRVPASDPTLGVRVNAERRGTPPPDSLFLTGDGRGGRATGGLFSLDGVHPTTVGYGILAQEIMTIMQRAGVAFYGPNGGQRDDPVTVDFARLLRLDTLVQHPPQNITSTLDVLGWADEAFGWSKRALTW